jgi:hypothetical protein
MRLLNTAEAADYLRLKERKLYERVARVLRRAMEEAPC